MRATKLLPGAIEEVGDMSSTREVECLAFPCQRKSIARGADSCGDVGLDSPKVDGLLIGDSVGEGIGGSRTTEDVLFDLLDRSLVPVGGRAAGPIVEMQ